MMDEHRTPMLTAEAHNRRDRAYCEAVARKFGHTYFWDEYRHLNQSWRNPSYAKPLPELLEDMKVLLRQNHHAHIIVDWLNHETGKTVKIDSNVCKELDRLTSNFPSVLEDVNRTQNRGFRR